MSDESNRRSWLGAAFGMIFVLSGLAAAYGSGGKMIVGYLATANWIELPATIHHLELASHRGSDTTTYSVKSRYSYTFNGTRYENDRVSISGGSDNIGSYWQDLYRSLEVLQNINEASVYVDMNKPVNSLLDRTFRWPSVIFASIFLFIFCGVGGFITWASLRKQKSRDVRLQDESKDGIVCNEKTGSFLLAGFGSIFFVMGAGMSLLIIPDAMRKGDYPALFVLVFAFVGAGIMLYAFKTYCAYVRFGPTPLFLDPPQPGVGGQLGGAFAINTVKFNQELQSETPIKMLLTCSKKRKSGDSTSTTILWQEESTAYISQTAQGVKGQFIFEVPEDCRPSKEWESRSSIDWEVAVEGVFDELGKFERSWEVHVAEVPAQKSNVVSIPEPFLRKVKEKSRERAKTSVLDQIPVTEDARYLEVLSKAGRHLLSNFMMLLFGLIFGGIGLFVILEGWLPGYAFLLVGALISIATVYSLGKSLEVKIDKQTKTLYTRQSFFGFVFSHKQGELVYADQFTIKLTSSQTSGRTRTEFYAVNFESDGNTIRVAERIAGKKAAEALKELIVERFFTEEAALKAA